MQPVRAPFSLEALDLEIDRIKGGSKRQPRPIPRVDSPQNVQIKKEQSPVTRLMQQLEERVVADLQPLGVELGKKALTIVRQKMGQVRSMCYSNSQQYPTGQQMVMKLVSDICTLANAKRSHFPDIPDVVLLRAMEELLDPKRTSVEVLECLVSYHRSVRMPTAQLARFPEEFRAPIIHSIVQNLASISRNFDRTTPQVHQQSIDDQIASLETKTELMNSVLLSLREIQQVLGPEIDASQLAFTAFRYLNEANKDPFFFAESKKIIIKHFLEELRKRGWQLFDTSSYCTHVNKKHTFEPAAYKAQKKQLFHTLVRPNAYIIFCQKLARTNATFGQLLALYQQFHNLWDTPEEFTLQEVEEMLSCLDEAPQANEISLVPETKIRVCNDTRNFPIHLKKVALDTLFNTIPLSSKIHEGIFGRSAHKITQEPPGRLTLKTKMEIPYSRSTTQGRRSSMQDADLVTAITLSDGTECPFFAIMDGHGENRIAADFLKLSLASTVQTWLNAALYEKDNFEVAVRNAMKIGMIQLNHVLKNALGPVVDYAGTTAIFSFICRDLLFTVNIGDSRALASTGHQLSLDANETSALHMRKITKRHGTVDDKGRVGELAVFSTFGDFANPHICAFATIHALRIIQSFDGRKIRLLLACDGVTDVEPSPKLLSSLQQGATAYDIVYNAVHDGSGDNVSAIVAEIPYTIPGLAPESIPLQVRIANTFSSLVQGVGSWFK